MEPFRRRTYHSLGEFLTDVRVVVRNRRRMRTLMRGETISNAFRERLMLAVTQVNACRYCADAHAKQALVWGLAEESFADLAEGDFESSPIEERPALLYAQHWAEANAQPDPAARRRLHELYGTEKANAIELSLRVIRVGNLLGNTWDLLLYTISRGRWGTDSSN